MAKTSLSDDMTPSPEMPDERHRGPYPAGKKLQMTRTWKLAVLGALAANAQAEPKRVPSTFQELQNELEVGQGMIGRLLKMPSETDIGQQTSALVEPISAMLGIALPMIETPSTRTLPDDVQEELDTYSVDEIRRILAAAAILRERSDR